MSSEVGRPAGGKARVPFRRPLWIALLILGAYAAWFIVPALLGISTGGPPAAGQGIAQGGGMLVAELVVALMLLLVVSRIGWWRKSGFFRRPNPGSLKFFVPPLLLVALILVVARLSHPEAPGIMGFADLRAFGTLLLAMLLLGFNEEMIFRGIAFHGLGTVLRPLAVVVVAAVVFGLFHFVNLLTGQPLAVTAYQVMHAMAAGFMYGALRLRAGALWPVMLFHAVWDTSLFVVSSLRGAAVPADGAEISFNPLQGVIWMLPALLYGLFVCWRWRQAGAVPLDGR